MKKWLLLGIPAVTVAVACSSSTVSPDAGTSTDSGTPTATVTGTSTGTSPPPDASIPLPAPATIDLTTGTCTEAVPCGGALEGTWDYSAGCVSDGALSNLENRVKTACATATLSGVSGTLSGRLTFAGSSVTRKATIELTGNLDLPKICTDAAGGDCSLVAAGIRQAAGTLVKSVSCAAKADGCGCKVATSNPIDKSGTTFTTSGDTLVTSDGDEYAYCVQGTKLTHKLTKAGVADRDEPGSYEATKR